LARGVVIAAPCSGSGKTVVTLGILRALRNRGVKVASAKAGPDYIDPRFHEAATGRPCFNLDPWAMSGAKLRAYLGELAQGADMVIIEGAMGLFDAPESGKGSTADLANELGLGVILVVDCSAMAQSSGAVVRGFDQPRPLAAVILNRIASARHGRIVRSSLDGDRRVLGAVFRSKALSLPSRHLGLVQANEKDDLEGFLESAAAVVGSSVDLDALLDVARPIKQTHVSPPLVPALGKRIALASDRAFGFAYPHLLHDWRRAGSEIVTFSPLADEEPDPHADSIFLPGGYPELHAARLSGNRRFLRGLRAAAQRGVLIYGECGGFMVLGDYLIDGEGARYTMAGLLPIGTSFANRQLHLGYRLFRHHSALPFPSELKGHEFHYSSIDWQDGGEPLFHAADASGNDLGAMGMARGNVMGSYAHIIS
jgi:cobyrinic acid a,c-diamide synthase